MVTAIKGTWTITPTASPWCGHVWGFASGQRYNEPVTLMGTMRDAIS